jgi:hypothetical protein
MRLTDFAGRPEVSLFVMNWTLSEFLGTARPRATPARLVRCRKLGRFDLRFFDETAASHDQKNKGEKVFH